MTTTTTPTTPTPSGDPGAGLDVPALFDRYAATFATRDVDAIAALHAERTEFRLRLGAAPAEARTGVREAFAGFFAQFAELGFEVHRVLFGPDHWVLDWALTARPAGPDGTPVAIRFDCLDVVTVDPDGLVRRKDTFVDTAQMDAALAGLGGAT
jgi:hypothetical protein